MTILIAGGRDFDNYRLLDDSVMSAFRSNQNKYAGKTIIVSGRCPTGADALGEQFAKRYNLLVREFPADWDKHGKSAGPIRNKQMAEVCDIAVIFWDGKSRGTKNMIEELNKAGKPTTIISY